MKKFLFIFLLFFLFQNPISATHNAGGEITLKQLASQQYEAKLTTYTVASSAPADRDSLEICWGDGSCEWIQRDTFYFIDCDIKQNIYKEIHLYANEGTFVVSLSDPNRNGGIINLNPPISDNVVFHIQTTLKVSSLWNSTPELLNVPTDIGQVGNIFQHNTVAIDWDGDSLSYSLIVPMQSVNTDVPNYFFPDEISPSTDNIISIHEEFGTLTWDSPAMSGKYTIAILITEHRGGQILSETIRDIQIGIGPGPNPNSSPPQSSVTTNEVTLSVGDVFNYPVSSEELDGENLLMQVFGLPPLLLQPSEFSLDSAYLPTPIEGDFSWTITDAHVLLEPYYVVFRIEDDSNDDCSLTKYEVLKININDSPTSVQKLEQLNFKVFPNPVIQDFITLQLPPIENDDNNQYKITNLNGQVLKEGKLESNQSSLTIDLEEIRAGSYMILIETKTKFGAQTFIKSN